MDYIDLIVHIYIGLILFIAYLSLRRAANAQSHPQRGESQNVNNFVTTMPQLEQVLNDVETANGISENSLQIVATLNERQQDLKAEVAKVSSSITRLEESLKSIQSSTQQFDRILLGPQSKGALGEWMISQRLSQLPKGWIEHNVPFRNDTHVEFCLRTPDGRLVPIDSKWTGTHLLDRLGQETDPTQRTILIRALNSRVISRAREIHKYIDDYRTVGFGIVAVPDPVFEFSASIQSELVHANIVLVSYSLLVPYLLILMKVIFSNAQSTQAWQTSRIIERSLLQIEELQKFIDTKVRGPLDSVMLQQSEYNLHNKQIQEALDKLSQIQNDINAVRSSLPSVIDPLYHPDIAAIPNTLQYGLSQLRESLIDGAAKQNGHILNDANQKPVE